MWFWGLVAWGQEEPEPAEPEPVEEAEPAPEEAPPPAPRTYTMTPVEADLPSALTRRDQVPDDPEALDDFLRQTGFEPGDFERPALIQGAWFIRPQLAIAQLLGDADGGPVALRVGASAGRRWSTLQVLPVQVMAEVGVRASAPVGGARGSRFEGFASIGPWLGPVRVQLGLHARQERERWRKGSLVLDDATFVGGDLQVALDVGKANLSLGLLPLVEVAGDRPSARDGDPVLPVLGTETVYSAGLGVQPGVFGLRVHGSWRDTAIGGLLEVGASLSARLGGS